MRVIEAYAEFPDTAKQFRGKEITPLRSRDERGRFVEMSLRSEKVLVACRQLYLKSDTGWRQQWIFNAIYSSADAVILLC